MSASKKIRAKCKACKHLYTSYGKMGACFFSKNPKLYRGTCTSYKKGQPFIPRIEGKLSKVLPFNPQKSSSWILYNTEHTALIVTWIVNANGVGFWKIHHIGLLPNGGIATKEFEKGVPQAAFAGSVSVVGPGTTDLFTSFNYSDDDQIDEEDNIVNKPKEIRVYPEKMNAKRKRNCK
jgi:hypothetical protein